MRVNWAPGAYLHSAVAKLIRKYSTFNAYSVIREGWFYISNYRLVSCQPRNLPYHT